MITYLLEFFMNKNLGRLEKVDLREIWEKEDMHFTPWLAQEQNMELLSSTIGMDLIVEAQEKDVGPFRADILCKDYASNNLVLIENQLEKTDHKHLGQLLTYATGLKAVSIIWIASEFNDEHRATLDWLNDITDENYNFFGIIFELYKIGNSNIAPNFKIVSKPNNWSKRVTSAKSKIQNEELGETKLLQLKFWSALNEKIIEKEDTPLKPQKPTGKHWHTFSIGKSGVNLNMKFNTRTESLGTEIYIINDKSIFDQLEKDKNEIEKKLNSKLSWEPLPTRSASRIILYRENSDLFNESKWNDYIEWSIEKLEKFHSIFSSKLKMIE